MNNYSVLVLALIYCSWCSTLASIHGGTFLAMAGKDSIVLVSDSRFSSQKTGSMLLGKYPRQAIRIGSRCLVGCFGLENDSRTLMHMLRQKLSSHTENELGPECISRVVSNVLYDNDFLLSPIVIGLNDDNSPHICTMDGLGAQTISEKFAVVGTANAGLMALCESLFVPNLDASSLVDLAQHCFTLAMQRDVMSGCDFRLLTITPHGIYQKDIEREDV